MILHVFMRLAFLSAAQQIKVRSVWVSIMAAYRSQGYHSLLLRSRPAGLVCLGDGQTEAYLKYMGITGLASAWAMARRKPI